MIPILKLISTLKLKELQKVNSNNSFILKTKEFVSPFKSTLLCAQSPKEHLNNIMMPALSVHPTTQTILIGLVS
jgi:hypothetical protein